MVAVRKSLHIAAGIIVVATMAFIAIRPTNDFAFVRQYIDGERTSYQEIHQTTWSWPPIHGSPGTETVDYVEVHSVNLQGRPNKEFAQLLREHFSVAKGWTEDSPASWDKENYAFNRFGNHLDLTRNGGRITVEAWPLGADRVSLKETKKLSFLQRWLVRLSHAGGNPFDKVYQ